MPFQIKRVREPAANSDGVRYLVDGLWPRGLSKERVQADGWRKELAPSRELRRWYGHDRERWEEFRTRYHAELTGNAELWRELVAEARATAVTLLCDARDVEHSNAAALREFLESRTA